MTIDDARAALSTGAATLRQVAQAWRCPPAEAYGRLYQAPMPPPVRTTRPPPPTITGRLRPGGRQRRLS